MSDLPPPPPPGSAPPPPPFQPPPGYSPLPPPPSSAPPGGIPPAGYAGPQIPPSYVPAAVVGAATGAGLMSQFGGAAAWSIGLGIVSIVVPFVSTFYFPIMPIIGGLNGVRAIQRGRIVGGIVGLVLNAIGGIVALIASRLIGG